MKKLVFTIFSVLLLVACSRQDNSQQNAEIKADVQNALTFVEQQKKRAVNYSETDPAVHLNILEAFTIVKSLYPDMSEQHLPEKYMFQMTTSSNEQITSFHPFDDWVSIKGFYGKSNQNLQYIMVEVYDKTSYQQSKQKAFDICKNIWKDIDNRIPNVIDELANRLNEYEQQNSSARTVHVRYGYRYYLDASHYQDGYPVACSVGNDKT